MNRKIKKIFLLPLFIGIGLIVAGIVSVIVTVKANGPSNTMFLMPVFFGLGGFVLTIVTPVVALITNNQKPEENVTDTSFTDVFKDFAKSVKKINEKECKYCGTTLKLEDTSCPNCGAKDID